MPLSGHSWSKIDSTAFEPLKEATKNYSLHTPFDIVSRAHQAHTKDTSMVATNSARPSITARLERTT